MVFTLTSKFLIIFQFNVFWLSFTDQKNVSLTPAETSAWAEGRQTEHAFQLPAVWELIRATRGASCPWQSQAGTWMDLIGRLSRMSSPVRPQPYGREDCLTQGIVYKSAVSSTKCIPNRITSFVMFPVALPRHPFTVTAAWTWSNV